jgi:hypothetical protein
VGIGYGFAEFSTLGYSDVKRITFRVANVVMVPHIFFRFIIEKMILKREHTQYELDGYAKNIYCNSLLLFFMILTVLYVDYKEKAEAKAKLKKS